MGSHPRADCLVRVPMLSGYLRARLHAVGGDGLLYLLCLMLFDVRCGSSICPDAATEMRQKRH